jgi:hypothetical protein
MLNSVSKHLLTMASGILDRSVVISTNSAPLGGSSTGFRSASTPPRTWNVPRQGGRSAIRSGFVAEFVPELPDGVYAAVETRVVFEEGGAMPTENVVAPLALTAWLAIVWALTVQCRC